MVDSSGHVWPNVGSCAASLCSTMHCCACSLSTPLALLGDCPPSGSQDGLPPTLHPPATCFDQHVPSTSGHHRLPAPIIPWIAQDQHSSLHSVDSTRTPAPCRPCMHTDCTRDVCVEGGRGGGGGVRATHSPGISDGSLESGIQFHHRVAAATNSGVDLMARRSSSASVVYRAASPCARAAVHALAQQLICPTYVRAVQCRVGTC